ncbi:MAG: DUF2145 domain-containing protein [Bdellovibrionales bacterium]|nr:DUF2145 domain-containing protein [Bdellovibrionales bacterium]
MKVSPVTKITLALALALGVISTTPVLAQNPDLGQNPGGKNCKEEIPTKAEMLNGGLLTSQVMNTINQERAKAKARGEELDVVILARTGTDPGSSRVLRDFDDRGRYMSVLDLYGGEQPGTQANLWSTVDGWVDHRRREEYSHLGFAFRNHPLAAKIQKEQKLPEKPWMMVHMLKPCGTLEPDLFDEGVWNFFLDKPYKFGALVIVPTYDLQKRLEQVVLKDKQAYSFLGRTYNALALPGDDIEQNSNQWPLEVMAAALNPRGAIRTRPEAINELQRRQYIPTRIHLRGKYSFAKLSGPASVSFKKQPSERGGQIIVEAITVLSVREFLQRQRLIINEIPLELSGKQLIIDDESKSNNSNDFQNRNNYAGGN